MKESEITEAPVRVKDEYSMRESALFISPSTLKRDFKYLGAVGESDDYEMWLYKTNASAVVTMPALYKKVNPPVMSNKIVVDLTLDMKSGIPVKNELQVSGVQTAQSQISRGLASSLYLAIAKAGYTVVSDYVQSTKGAELWRKIAQLSANDNCVVRVWSQTSKDWLRNANNEVLVYDASNLSDDQIWIDLESYTDEDLAITALLALCTSNNL